VACWRAATHDDPAELPAGLGRPAWSRGSEQQRDQNQRRLVNAPLPKQRPAPPAGQTVRHPPRPPQQQGPSDRSVGRPYRSPCPPRARRNHRLAAWAMTSRSQPNTRPCSAQRPTKRPPGHTNPVPTRSADQPQHHGQQEAPWSTCQPRIRIVAPGAQGASRGCQSTPPAIRRIPAIRSPGRSRTLRAS